MPPPSSFAQCSIRSLSRDQFHTIAFTRWGERGRKGTVICVHGLTRQGRDFDFLAGRLAAQGYEVVCPDVVGRGLSGRLTDPSDYDLEQYEIDMAMLMASLGADGIDWIGTSLGGLIGILLAGRANSPIRRLIVNDIGPDLPLSAVLRIGTYVRAAPASFPNRDAAETYFRSVLAPWGNLTSEQWRHLSDHSVEERADGRLAFRYDREIPRGFRSPIVHRPRLWASWSRIRCPILILRGETSDLLLPATVDEMLARNPNATAIEVANVGHVPPLLDETQSGLVESWLERTAPTTVPEPAPPAAAPATGRMLASAEVVGHGG